MKKIILFILLTGFVFSYVKAQEESIPVAAFESSYLIDDQTTTVADLKTLGFAIQHKFATMENGVDDLWGIYGAATNIRLALDYVPFKNVQIGAGLSKSKMMADFNLKWAVLRQTSDNKMPVSLTLLGVAAIDNRPAEDFPTGKVVDSKDVNAMPTDIVFSDRMSYHSQLMVSRKFGEVLSLQAGASFTHYNMVDWDQNHDLVGLHAMGRIKVTTNGSLIATYNAPLAIKDISEQNDMPDYKPTFAIGWQISTYTHAFQLYVGNASSMLPQENMMYNRTKFNKDGIAIGFTITRLWAF